MLLLQPLKALLDDVCGHASHSKSSLMIDGAIFCRRNRKWLSKKALRMKYQQQQQQQQHLSHHLKYLAWTAANYLSHYRNLMSCYWGENFCNFNASEVEILLEARQPPDMRETVRLAFDSVARYDHDFDQDQHHNPPQNHGPGRPANPKPPPPPPPQLPPPPPSPSSAEEAAVNATKHRSGERNGRSKKKSPPPLPPSLRPASSPGKRKGRAKRKPEPSSPPPPLK